jgi:hypothetical protein
LLSLNRLVDWLRDVPGMTTDATAQLLFPVAFGQQIDGDIVEIGSWQGRSTICLARAALLSGNGTVNAIKYFMGNQGKESYYKLGQDDLPGLKSGFISNIKRNHVYDAITIMDMDTASAAPLLKRSTVGIRLLFIDGSHEYEDIRADHEHFSGSLRPGAQVLSRSREICRRAN